MKTRDKYHPDYKKLYPGERITPEVLSALKQSDRKMEYMEVDLKREGFRQDLEAMTTEFIPSREDSYERLQDDENAKFLLDEPTPEDKAIHRDELMQLYAALEQLEPDELLLIKALYFDGLSERELGKTLGIPQRTLHDRKVRIQRKLRKLMESK